MIYGYIRVSTEKQTVEVQRYEINRYCRENGIEVDAWIEESISGAIKPSARLLGKLILDRIKKGEIIKEDSLSVYETFFDIISAQKERELISRRTKCALAMMKSNGVRLGRPVGIPRKRKLDGKDSEITKLLERGLSKAEVARRLGVSQTTLSEFMKIKHL